MSSARKECETENNKSVAPANDEKKYQETLWATLTNGRYMLPLALKGLSLVLVVLSGVCLAKQKPTSVRDAAKPTSLAVAGAGLFFGARHLGKALDRPKKSDNDSVSRPSTNQP